MAKNGWLWRSCGRRAAVKKLGLKSASDIPGSRGEPTSTKRSHECPNRLSFKVPTNTRIELLEGQAVKP